MFKSTILVTVFSLLGTAINFGIQLLTAYYFGTGEHRDIFFAALTVPTYITNLLLSTVIVFFLPRLIQHQTNEGEQAANRFASRFLHLFSITLLVVILLSVLFSRPLLQATLPGFNEQQLATTIPLFRILMISLFFTNCTNLFAAILQSRLLFVWGALAPIITAIVTGLVIGTGARQMGITSLAIGTLAGSVIAFIILLLVTFKKIRYYFSWNFRDGSIVGIIRLTLPLLITGIVCRSISIFERMFSSNYPSGSISYLGYATLIITSLTSITSSGIATSIFPSLSKKYAENDLAAFKSILEKGTRLILFLILPISVVLSLFGTQLVEIMFERGEFTATDSQAVGFLLMLFVGALIGNSLGSVVVKVFYILGKAKLSSAYEFTGLLLYVIPGYLVSRYFPYQGLAVVSSVNVLLNILIAILLVNKLLNGIRIKHILSGGAIALLASLLVYAVAYFLYNNWLTLDHRLLRYAVLIALLGISTLSYLALMLWVFKVPEFDELFLKLYKRVNKNQAYRKGW